MAGTAKHRAVSERPLNRRTRRRSSNNRRIYRELMESAGAQMMTCSDTRSPEKMLMEVLGRAVANMRYAASEVDKLEADEFWVKKIDAQGNVLVEPNKWYQLEQACREEVQNLSGLIAQLGLAERMVKVEEAQAELIKRVIVDAARDAGLPAGAIRKLGPAIRDRLQLVQGEGAEAA